MPLLQAVLGFLSIQPMSGYDLKKAFDQSVGHFWTADQAQIYRTLARLLDEGLVTVDRVEQDRRPDRKEHRLTDAGKAELDAWLSAPLEPATVRDPFLLRVFFAERLGRESVQQLLRQRIEEARQQLAELNEIVSTTVAHVPLGSSLDLGQRLRLATLDNGITHTEAEIAWAGALLRQIAQEGTP